jgi:hypothetical protein
MAKLKLFTCYKIAIKNVFTPQRLCLRSGGLSKPPLSAWATMDEDKTFLLWMGAVCAARQRVRDFKIRKFHENVSLFQSQSARHTYYMILKNIISDLPHC